MVLDTNEAIFLHSSEEFSLGRATPGQPIVPDIDLTPYNAYETGVSRLHASLNIVSRPITVQDLGSVNGTRVNGKKLPPHSATSISNGDILTLGKLKVQIIIKAD
jgi:pSer/pThr/pTyr-binding forkhead associated (FHA) protein